MKCSSWQRSLPHFLWPGSNLGAPTPSSSPVPGGLITQLQGHHSHLSCAPKVSFSGLTKKFIQVFPPKIMEPKQTFWSPQYVNYNVLSCEHATLWPWPGLLLRLPLSSFWDHIASCHVHYSGFFPGSPNVACLFCPRKLCTEVPLPSLSQQTFKTGGCQRVCWRG